METFKEFTSQSNEIDQFIGKCLMTVTYAHALHFAVSGVGSYAKHVALGEFYEELQEITDRFAETHIGIVGRFVPSLSVSDNVDEVKLIKDLISGADKIYGSVDTCLQSILDELKELCYKTLYKLTKLA